MCLGQGPAYELIHAWATGDDVGNQFSHVVCLCAPQVRTAPQLNTAYSPGRLPAAPLVVRGSTPYVSAPTIGLEPRTAAAAAAAWTAGAAVTESALNGHKGAGGFSLRNVAATTGPARGGNTAIRGTLLSISPTMSGTSSEAPGPMSPGELMTTHASAGPPFTMEQVQKLGRDGRDLSNHPHYNGSPRTTAKTCQFRGCGTVVHTTSRQAWCAAHLHNRGRGCKEHDCPRLAQGSTLYCTRHGGGRRCKFTCADGEPCTKSAAGSNMLCKAHGGGRRCTFEGCPKSAQGNTFFCMSHGGGRRCSHGSGCRRIAISTSPFCRSHGGGRVCRFDGAYHVCVCVRV